MRIDKKKLLILIILVTLLVSYFIYLNIFGNKIRTKVNNLTPVALTNQPRLEDDFYNSINYQFLNKSNIEKDEYYWHYIYNVSNKKIDEEKKYIIDDILSKCNSYNENSNYKKICNFYNSYNTSSENTLKNELNKYIELINNSNTIEEYIKNAININYNLSIDILVNPKINSEINGSSKPFFTLDIISYDYKLEFQNNDLNYLYNTLYTDELYSQYLNYLRKYDIAILEKYGYSSDDANLMVNNIENMYSEIARFSLKSDKYLNNKGYKLYSINEVQKELKHINIYDILSNYSDIYNNNDKIMIADINQLKSIDNYLVLENLDTLKYYAIMQILTSYAKYINEEFYKIDLKMNDYFNYYLGGQVTNYANESVNKNEYIYASIYNFFQDTITEEFAKRNFTSNEKEFYKNLINEEIKEFKENISNKEWLSDSTKEKAIEKLDNIKYNIGTPDEFVFVENQYNLESNYMANIITMNQQLKKQENIQLLSGNKMYGIDYLVQNAYYMPLDNSINILLGIIYSYKTALNLDTNNLEKNYYELLGSIGTIIGHELTHSLDSLGSKYDKNGNYINWWTNEDKEKFDKLNLKVIKYYDKYDEFGDKTLGENIADLGGIKLALQVASEKGAQEDDYKKLFESYAITWCSQSTSYYNAYLLKNDVHSLDKVRVNAVLSSIDKFYEVYNIKPTDKMFVLINDRVSVW